MEVLGAEARSIDIDDLGEDPSTNQQPSQEDAAKAPSGDTFVFDEDRQWMLESVLNYPCEFCRFLLLIIV